jgi:hypothetical protein
MVDTRIRKNERCVIGLPACDYVFSSTRSCFIAYGFSTSGLERDILKNILKEHGIEAVEAGGRIEPAKFAFCTKICSKIIVAQFCIVLVANHDRAAGSDIPNANVNIEYGLMLGHNKYIIPFQRDDQSLPFNVAGLDTIKYKQGNFAALATSAIEQAIRETSQNQPSPNIDQMVTQFLLVKNATIVDVASNPVERSVFQLGHAFNFNFLVKFDGLSYVFLGNFGALQGTAVIWRIAKLAELLDARRKAVPTRVQFGLAVEDSKGVVDFFMQRLEIWLIVNGEKEQAEILGWLATSQTVPFRVGVFTLKEVADTISQLP